MKKFFILVLTLFMSFQLCLAKNEEKDYTLNFDGQKYYLLYSVKNKDFGGYLNEYYRRGETYNIWSDMVAIHHFPNAYSPIDRIKDFKDYLSDMNVPSSLTFDDKNNAAMIDFIMITNKNLPVVLEFNIFKYEKSKKCGSVAIQYVKRYSATNTLQIEEIKKDFEKNRKKLIKKVKQMNIPQIITEDIDKCISGIEINKQTAADIAKLEAEKKIAAEENENEDVINQINKIFSDGASDTAEDNLIKPGQQEAKLETPDFKLHGSEELTCVVSDTTSDKFEQKKETEEVAQKPEINKNKTNPENMNQTPKNNTIKEEPATPIAVAAPVPQEQKTKIQSNSQEENNKQQIKKEKNIKKTKFVIENNKEEYIAKPRTNKELKKLKKQNKKNNKKSKVKKTPYEVTNNKDTYLAVPRNKQEMKEYTRLLKEKQKAKQRAKKAKNKLKE